MTQEMNNIFRLINVGNCNVLIDSIRPVNVIPKTCEPGAGKLFVPIFTTLQHFTTFSRLTTPIYKLLKGLFNGDIIF